MPPDSTLEVNSVHGIIWLQDDGGEVEIREAFKEAVGKIDLEVVYHSIYGDSKEISSELKRHRSKP